MVLVGERRMRAARLAGLATLDCVMVEEPIAADELLVIQLVENARGRPQARRAGGPTAG